MDSAAYLDRLDLSPAAVESTDGETLRRLQRAHVTAVPFETLAVAGDPFGTRAGDGVSLALGDLYRKIVTQERGGFCYELNGLFGRLLDAVGFDAKRVAARVIEDGDLTPPASHMTHVVDCDRRYVVDVGLGTPAMRRPTPLDGTVVSDAAGVDWRTVESDRPDADYCTQYREPGAEWRDRYIFTETERDRSYFRATCDHLTTAPESGFTGDPVVSMATGRGHKRLTVDTLTERARGEVVEERAVEPGEWLDVLEAAFGVRWPPES